MSAAPPDGLPPSSTGASAPSPAALPETPWYTLGEALGEGAFATVYACTLPGHASSVAAKVVSRKAKWVWIGGRTRLRDFPRGLFAYLALGLTRRCQGRPRTHGSG